MKIKSVTVIEPLFSMKIEDTLFPYLFATFATPFYLLCFFILYFCTISIICGHIRFLLKLIRLVAVCCNRSSVRSIFSWLLFYDCMDDQLSLLFVFDVICMWLCWDFLWYCIMCWGVEWKMWRCDIFKVWNDVFHKFLD